MWHMTLEGTRAPELVGGDQDWINSPPIYLRDLSQKIVLIDIWDYTCVNCLRTIPYVKEWHERYKPWGLLVIGVHTPEFEFAKSRQNVEEAVNRLAISYPVLLDSNHTNWNNFANRYWPRKLLINADRRIVHDQIGEGGYGEFETEIHHLIKSMHPEAMLPEVMEAVRPEDKPGAVCYPATPETYAGYRRGNLGNDEGYVHDVAHAYADPGRHQDGVLYLRGTWRATSEALMHARETVDLEDYILLRYHANDVNAVIRPTHDAVFDVFVTQDGHPVSEENRGEDIRVADNGETYLHVDFSRMYKIIRNRKIGEHELRLSSTSNAFGLYAFTFGSCVQPGESA